MEAFTNRVLVRGAHTVKPKVWLNYCVAMGKLQHKDNARFRCMQEEMVKVFQTQGHV